MPILITKKLILVNAKQIDITDKRTGEKLKKWRYTFFSPEGKLVVGYDSNGLYKNDVKTISKWDESQSKEYVWELTYFQGETKEKLFADKYPQ